MSSIWKKGVCVRIGMVLMVVVLMVSILPIGLAETKTMYEYEWNLEVVDDSTYAGAESELRIGTDGISRMACSSNDGYDVTFGKRTSNGWEAELVKHYTCCVESVQMTLDSANTPHIVALDYGEWHFDYFTKVNGEWIEDTIDDNGGAKGFIDIDVDNNGIPNVVYNRFTDATGYYSTTQLNFARLINGEWVIEKVDIHVGIHDPISIRVDEKNRPHIAYGDSPSTKHGVGTVKYAVKDNGKWTVETVDENAYWFESPSVAIDSDNEPHIAYAGRNGEDDCIKYANRNNGEWEITILEMDGGFYEDTVALTIDSEDDPHILFNDYNGLRYSEREDGVWYFDYVYFKDTDWYFKSIELDSNDKPRLLYFDHKGHYLSYAWLESREAFQIEQTTVDDANEFEDESNSNDRLNVNDKENDIKGGDSKNNDIETESNQDVNSDETISWSSVLVILVMVIIGTIVTVILVLRK